MLTLNYLLYSPTDAAPPPLFWCQFVAMWLFAPAKKRKIKKESKEKHEQKEYVYKTEEKDRTALETFSGDQFTLSTQLIKPRYLVDPPHPPPPITDAAQQSLYILTPIPRTKEYSISESCLFLEADMNETFLVLAYVVTSLCSKI